MFAIAFAAAIAVQIAVTHKNPPADERFRLSSPDVVDGGILSKDFTGDGTSSTLPLEWGSVPKGTKSFALIMHHIAPDKTKCYWILYNIPADTKGLPKNVHGVGRLGMNNINGKMEYAPPHSKGPGTKLYIYTLYALSSSLYLRVPTEQVTRENLMDAMKGLILQTAELHVTYTRFPEPNSPQTGNAIPAANTL